MDQTVVVDPAAQPDAEKGETAYLQSVTIGMGRGAAVVPPARRPLRKVPALYTDDSRPHSQPQILRTHARQRQANDGAERDRQPGHRQLSRQQGARHAHLAGHGHRLGLTHSGLYHWPDGETVYSPFDPGHW